MELARCTVYLHHLMLMMQTLQSPIEESLPSKLLFAASPGQGVAQFALSEEMSLTTRTQSSPDINVVEFESRTERLLNQHRRLEVSIPSCFIPCSMEGITLFLALECGRSVGLGLKLRSFRLVRPHKQHWRVIFTLLPSILSVAFPWSLMGGRLSRLSFPSNVDLI